MAILEQDHSKKGKGKAKLPGKVSSTPDSTYSNNIYLGSSKTWKEMYSKFDILDGTIWEYFNKIIKEIKGKKSLP